MRAALKKLKQQQKQKKKLALEMGLKKIIKLNYSIVVRKIVIKSYNYNYIRLIKLVSKQTNISKQPKAKKKTRTSVRFIFCELFLLFYSNIRLLLSCSSLDSQFI